MKSVSLKQVSFSLIIVVGVCLNVISAARILAILGPDLNSHFRVFGAFVEHIAPYHEVTFYLDSKLKYKGPDNVVIRHADAPSRIGSLNMTQIFSNPCSIDSYKLFYDHILIVNQSYYEDIYESNKELNLLYHNETYDLIIVAGYGSEHFFRFAHTLNIPFIQVTPSQLFPWHSKAVNNPYSWINDFSFMVPESTDSFLGRLTKFIKNALISYRFNGKYLSAINKATEKYFPPGTPKVEEVIKATDLIFVNTHNVLGYTRPNVPTIIEIGGLHIKPPKALPTDLEEFIQGAGEDGFIYFSLGSFIQESSIKESVRKSILNVFKKLPQRILWKSKNKMPDAPPNVKISKWFPQEDILAHKNIKLFISQGGMLSTLEGVYHGVPLLIFPVIFDQYNNAYLIEQRGSGKSITFCHFKEKLFEKHITELLNNSTYSEIAQKMSKAMKHQNENLPQKINWWVDFVLQNKGASILRPLIKYDLWTDMPYDILIFFVILISITLYLFFNIFMYFSHSKNNINVINKIKNA